MDLYKAGEGLRKLKFEKAMCWHMNNFTFHFLVLKILFVIWENLNNRKDG